eukprot:scaffold31977_cov107-Isochrysis_galbana.AAC.1
MAKIEEVCRTLPPARRHIGAINGYQDRAPRTPHTPPATAPPHPSPHHVHMHSPETEIYA